MADNTTLDAGVGGNSLRTLEDASSVHWPVGVVAYATTVGTPDVLTIPTAAALADATANPTTLVDGACVLMFNGTTWDRVRGDTTNGLDVDVTRLPSTTNAGATAKTTDYDTGVGTDTVTMFGIALPASGGAVAGGTSSNPIRTDPTGTTTQPVSGTVTANQGGAWSVTVSGTVTVDSELPAAGSLADNTANPSTPLIGSCLMGFDGTTWDRIYTVADGDVVAAAAKGFLVLGTDGANYQVLATNSSGHQLVNVQNTVTTTISGAVDTELPAAGALADALANPTTPSVGACALLFNGTTWDRIRGDTTNGIDVDVTRVSGNVTVVNAGTFATQAAQSGTWNISTVSTVTAVTSITNALPTGTNTIGAVNLKPTTSGGHLISRTLSAATTNATSVKASAGQVYGYYFSNTNASPRYLKLYNKATAPTVGTDTPVMTLLLPGNSSGVAGHVEFANGIEFSTGIAFALTTGVADADTAAVAANEIVLNLFYK